MKNVLLVVIGLVAVVGLLAFADAFGQVPIGNEEKIAADYFVMKVSAVVVAIISLPIFAADLLKKASKFFKEFLG